MLSSYIDLDFNKQKQTLINLKGKKQYTHGSSNSIDQHFFDLKKEFSGDPELCLTHAKLIVLIRREYKTKKYFDIFQSLWNEHRNFLLKNLNSRWLLSAADTFSDHSDIAEEKLLGVACSALLNTIKLYESERLLNDASFNVINVEIKNKLDDNIRLELEDGMSVFKFGTDDTLRNMRWRLNKYEKISSTGQILVELFNRLQITNTAYKRARDMHIRKNTEWWD